MPQHKGRDWPLCRRPVYRPDRNRKESIQPPGRLQCERELKSILISLRQGLLAAAGRHSFLEAVAIELGEKLVRTMRGMLWLKGRKEAKPAAAVVAEVEGLTDRRLDGVRAALDSGADHGWSEFEKLYEDVASLGNTVDGW